jgi:hypothetical protein
MAAMDSWRSNPHGLKGFGLAGRIVTTGLHDRWLMHAEFRLWYSAVVRSRCCVYNIVALGKIGTIGMLFERRSGCEGGRLAAGRVV